MSDLHVEPIHRDVNHSASAAVIACRLWQIFRMDIDTDKIDDVVLALLWLTLHDERCAWKSLDFAVTDRLHQKGLIADPVNKAKSIVLTDEGLRRSEELFRTLFMRPMP